MNLQANENTKIIEKIFRRNRWDVVIELPSGSRMTMPNAHHVWLKSNPAFIEIPKDYVIHHLDHDELNDDPSNLVLMQKHLHLAYHLKQKVIKPEIKIERATSRTVWYDGDPDKIHIYAKRKDRWYLNWYQNGERTRIFSWEGRSFFKSMATVDAAKEHLIKHGFINR